MKPKDDNSKDNDAGINEGSTALLTLGSPKTSRNKSSNEYEGLGEALDDLLNNGRIPIASRSNGTHEKVYSKKIFNPCDRILEDLA